MNEYKINNNFYLWHYDFYRCKEENSHLDFFLEYLDRDDGISLIEWPEKNEYLKNNFYKNKFIEINFFYYEEDINKRIIKVSIVY